MNPSHSILRRFSATLLANFIGAAGSFGAATLLARGLGASRYGDFSFLIASFGALNALFDLGAQQAFYTFLSQGGAAREHLRAFGSWLALRVLLVSLAVACLPQTWLDRVWMGQERGLILLAFAAFFASTPLRGLLVSLAESARQTVFVQAALAALSAAHVVCVAALWSVRLLTLANVYLLIALEYAALCVYFFLLYDRRLLDSAEAPKPWRRLAGQYAAYCSPLALYCALSFLGEFADRWLLQFFGGSAQQGLFSFSSQFATITLLATTAILNIFWKEIAEAQRRGELDRVREMYKRSSRTLFFVSAAGGCFLIPHSRMILLRLAGPAYERAWVALSLMLLYPAFQTLGQLNGAYFYATEDTRTHVRISSWSILLGLPLSYLVLAPAGAAVPGLGLGATGLALRWSLLQAAVVTWQCAVVARRQETASDALHHWLVLGILLCLAAAAKLADSAFFGLSAIVYLAGLGAVAWLLPGLAGIQREQILRILNRRLS